MIRNGEGKMKRVANDDSGVDKSANKEAATRPVKADGIDHGVLGDHRANWHGGPGRPSRDSGFDSDSDDQPLLSLIHMTESAHKAAVTGPARPKQADGVGKVLLDDSDSDDQPLMKRPRVQAAPSAGEGGGEGFDSDSDDQPLRKRQGVQEGFKTKPALEVAHGQILSQSPTDATRFW